MCQDQEMCWIHVSRQFFGKAECPETGDAEMNLWLVYSCDGGGTDDTTTHSPTCNSTTPPTSTPSTSRSQTSPQTPTGHCTHDDEGELVEENVPGCGGSLDIFCDEGCIAVHKVISLECYITYSCSNGKSRSFTAVERNPTGIQSSSSWSKSCAKIERDAK